MTTKCEEFILYGKMVIIKHRDNGETTIQLEPGLWTTLGPIYDRMRACSDMTILDFIMRMLSDEHK